MHGGTSGCSKIRAGEQVCLNNLEAFLSFNQRRGFPVAGGLEHLVSNKQEWAYLLVSLKPTNLPFAGNPFRSCGLLGRRAVEVEETARCTLSSSEELRTPGREKS